MAVISALLGKSWEILGNLRKSWEILKFFFISMKLSNGCYFRFAWEILGNLGEILKFFFILMKLSSGCYFRFAWEILGNLGKSWEILGNLGKYWNSFLFRWNYQMAVISDLLGKSWEILGNLGKSWSSSLFWWNYQMVVISDLLGKSWEILGNLGKSWEILGNLEILFYFDEIIKWLLFPICLGNFEISRFSDYWLAMHISWYQKLTDF